MTPAYIALPISLRTHAIKANEYFGAVICGEF